jgi:hypothetical protein
MGSARNSRVTPTFGMQLLAAALRTARCLFPLANHNRPKFQFTLNQDRTSKAMLQQLVDMSAVVIWWIVS